MFAGVTLATAGRDSSAGRDPAGSFALIASRISNPFFI
jgi:hypothetical protein